MSLPPASSSRAGRLIINPSGNAQGALETDLRCPAWWMLDLSSGRFPAVRGQNVIVPKAIGKRAYTKRVSETAYVSTIYVCGDVDRNASATPSGALIGLDDNLDDLWTNVGDPGVLTTRVAKRVQADGTALTADCQCILDLVRQKGPHAWLTMDLILTRGRFT